MGMYRTILHAMVMMAMFAIVLVILEHYKFFDRQTPRTDEQRATANMSAVAPSRLSARSGEYIINRANDGHFWVNAYVNGDEIRFMVDTGASFVVLSPDDAETLGFDFWDEDFSYRIRTATGEYAMAPIVIDEIEIGDDIRIFNVRGAVLNEGAEVSLLGLSFLNKLTSYQFSGDELILTP